MICNCSIFGATPGRGKRWGRDLGNLIGDKRPALHCSLWTYLMVQGVGLTLHPDIWDIYYNCNPYIYYNIYGYWAHVAEQPENLDRRLLPYRGSQLPRQLLLVHLRGQHKRPLGVLCPDEPLLLVTGRCRPNARLGARFGPRLEVQPVKDPVFQVRLQAGSGQD